MDHSYAFSGGSAGYDPRPASIEAPPGQVMIAVQQQEKLLSQLGETIGMLENRLGYGLRPAPPSAVGRGEDRTPAPTRSSFAEMLYGANARIAEANARLTDITSRVDL